MRATHTDHPHADVASIPRLGRRRSWSVRSTPRRRRRAGRDTTVAPSRPDELGIELDDVFADGFDNSTIDALHALTVQRRVVVLRNFGTDPDSSRALCRALTQRFTGHRRPFELRLESSTEKHSWNSDLSFLDHPPAVGVAALTGTAHPLAHTRWIDTARAYQGLPDTLKLAVEDARAVHSATADRGRLTFQTIHPLVRIHPVSGRRALFLGDSIQRIVGSSMDDSDRLIDLLRAHVVTRANQFTVRWTEGDVVVWDNASTMHDTLDGLGARGLVRAFGFVGRTPIGVDGRPSRARHGDPTRLGVTAARGT